MKSYLNDIAGLFLSASPLTGDSQYDLLLFSSGCAVIGFAAVLLDLAFYITRDRSLLRLRHGSKNTILFLLFWSMGSFLMGGVGLIFNIFEAHRNACVIVGFTWPILFTQLLSSLSKAEEKKEPEQSFEGEEI